MKTLRILLLLPLFIFLQLSVTPAFAKKEKTNTPKFMTPRDLLRSDANSNISLRNSRGAAVTVYGLYVRQFAYVTPGDTCDNASVTYPTVNPATINKAAGSYLMPTSISPSKSAAVGSNYLYNMIYEAIYFAQIAAGSSQCSLPGCTWGNDSTIYNWCIYLGALAPVTTSADYSNANIPPSGDSASDTGYDYNLVSSYVYLGPLSCNDRTLTCTAATPQTQSF